MLVGTSASLVFALGIGAGALLTPEFVMGEQPDAVARNQPGYFAGLAWERAQLADTTPPPPAPPLNPAPPSPKASAVLAMITYARAQLGEPYELGAMGPEKWDCSGLVKASYASVGVNVGSHSADDQFNTLASASRLVPLGQIAAGDLLWYSADGAVGADKYHTAIYIGAGMMLEAARPGTVVRIVPLRYGDLVPYAGRATP